MKYCILAAGLGSRLNTISGLHKALYPLGNKPVISHIIERLNSTVEIVIAVGHNSDQLKAYLSFVHKDRLITYVDVDNYDKEGSGPGYSLTCCKKFLQEPFTCFPCDAVVDKEFTGMYFGPINEDIIYGNEVYLDKAFSRILVLDDRSRGIRYDIRDTTHPSESMVSFTGVFSILNYERFWENHNDAEIVPTLNKMVGTRVEIDNCWLPTGDNKFYTETLSLFTKEIVPSKINEVLYIDNNKVVKYFSDRNKIARHKNRAKHLLYLIPYTTFLDPNMMGYNYVPGDTLSHRTDIRTFREFLEYYKTNLLDVKFDKTNAFLADCHSIYEAKTQARIANIADTYTDEIQFINGTKVERINDIIARIDWKKIYDLSLPVFIHGDLQPENIICDRRARKFTLIDWRESFGANIQTGDAYYDLSKLLHGLIVNNHVTMKNLYSVVEKDSSASIEFHIRSNLLDFTSELKRFCETNNLDWNNVELLCALHYLNIASLYVGYKGGTYSTFLFLLSKLLLTKKLDGHILFN